MIKHFLVTKYIFPFIYLVWCCFVMFHHVGLSADVSQSNSVKVFKVIQVALFFVFFFCNEIGP